MFFPFIPTEAWEEYLRSHGYDPTSFATGKIYEETFVCEICKQDLGDATYAILEPPPGVLVRRKYHAPCLVAHLQAHLDDATDEISNYVNRKPVST